MSVSPEAVETWINQSTSANSEQRLSATSHLQRLLAEGAPSTVVPLLLALLTQSTQESVCFYALSELSRYPHGRISAGQRIELLSFLFTGKNARLSPAYLRNKAAWLLATWLLQARWETYESDLQTLARSNPLLFLKTVESLLEQLVSTHERLNDSSIADEVRQFGGSEIASPVAIRDMRTLLKSGLAEGFCELILTILSSAPAVTTTGDESEAIVLSLKALQALFLVDVGTLSLLTINRVLEYLLMSALQPDKLSTIQLAALQVWSEWVHSGVEAELCSTTSTSVVVTVDESVGTSTTTELQDSVHLILDQRKIDIIGALLEKLHEYNLLPVSGESNAEIEVVIEISKLVSQIGLCILPVWCQCQQRQQQEPLAVYQEQIQGRMNQILDLFFRAFSYDDIDVSSAVIPLAASIVKMLDRDTVATGGEIVQKLQQHVPQMLNILYQQLKYPVGYDRESDDDVDAEEQLYRDELCKLYAKFVRVQPSLCLQFLCEASSQWLLLENLSSSSLATSPQDVEASLRLLYQYAEGIQPPPGVKTALEDPTFVSLLVAIHSSGLVRRFESHENHFVLLLYYEVSVRYSPLFQHEPRTHLLSPLLEAMSGTNGLQHPYAKMRSRCCFLLLRLVMSLSKLLRPFVETAVSGIQALLAQSSTQPNLLRVEDVMYLFETIGILVGKTGLDATQQQQYLTSLLTPHIQAMEEILSKTDVTRDVQHYGEILSCSISATTHLSKGFSKQPPIGVQTVLVETMRVTLRAVEALPSSESVRSKAMVLVQRMILCIGDKVLPFCPPLLFHLIANCTSDDILFVSQIFIQLCTKFKQRAVDVIDSPLMPFLRKCQSVVPQAEAAVDSDSPPHLRTEQLSIQKLAYAVLLSIVTNHATRVLLSTANVASLESVLRTVSDGAVLVRDGVIQRTCIKFFRELVKQWGEPPVSSSASVASDELVYRRGFMSFAIQVFLVGMMRTFSDVTFNLQDANQSRCVSELSHVLFGCLVYDADATLASVSSVLPNALGLRAATDVDLLDKALRELLVASRSGPSTNGFR